MFSQIDKEFWFVGPEASSNHGDRPVFIRVSTMEDTAHIVLRMPANLKFAPILRTINPNSTTSIQLDVINGNNTWLDSIENRPPDKVLHKGLLLTSDNYVTAYYDLNNGSNPALFSFKGKNGVGTEFYISGQTDYPNQTNDGSEAFDIVATQDGTTVTITPSIDIVGHLANVPFQVVLNKGETYSARTLITTASASLAGSHVVSDKPVAITLSDDSIVTGGWDIIGDQTVPVNLLGKEYIVIKGFADNVPPANDDERAYILATQDATDVTVDGTSVGTLNTGQQYDYPLPATTNTAYVKSTKPVYVYHLSGHPGEAGSSLLPPDSCTGSRKIGFNRSSTSAFALLILTRNGNQDFFLLNGGTTVLTGASFSVVPGTSNNWVYYRQNNLSTVQVPVGGNIIENTQGKFHLGILNNISASSEYGYFSDFSTLYLGADASICPGDSMVLDGGPYRTSYNWEKLIAGIWTTVGIAREYTVKDTGYYACMTNGDFCTLMDTIHISYYPNGSVSLGPDRTICQGTTTTFSPAGNYVSYQWSTGATGSSLTTGTPGNVWLRVTNNNGCVAHDTVMVALDSLPQASQLVTGPATVCQGQNNVTYNIDTLHFATSCSWTLPPGATGVSTTRSITLGFSTSATSGTLSVHGVNSCGTGPEISFPITVNPLPVSAGSITAPPWVCQGQNGIAVSVATIANAASYAWSLPAGLTIATGAGTNTITVNAGLNAVSGTISVNGHNTCGDGPSSSTPLTVKLFPVPAGAITGNATLCQGQGGLVYSVPVITGAGSYIWSLPAGATIASGAGTNVITVSFDSTAVSGMITVKGHSADCGDGTPSVFPVTVNPLPSPAGVITSPSPVCQGQNGISASIAPLANATSYVWALPPGCNIVTGNGTNNLTTSYGTNAVSGLYTVHGHNETCGDGRHASLPVTVNPLPLAAGTITGPTPVCQGEAAIAYSIPATDPLTTSYSWSLIPAIAGVIAGQTASISLTWDAGFTGISSLAVNGVNGCGSGPVSVPFSIWVNPKPNVSFLPCNDLSTTKNGRPILLKGGYPLGTTGVYSGTAVSQSIPGSYIFDPGSGTVVGSSAGTPYPVTYRYTNVYNCFREATLPVKVYLSNANQPCPGTVTDVRDGQIYPTMLAGSGAAARCWMAKNLNYGTTVTGNQPQSDNCIFEKYCAGDISAQCALSGGYYQWDELMNYINAEGAQGLCLPGWHLPSGQEWSDLENFYLGPGLAGNSLKDMNATYGFQGILAGLFYLNNSWKFTSGGLTGTMFWSSTTHTGLPVANGLNSINMSVSTYPSSPANAFPVRCVRDY